MSAIANFFGPDVWSSDDDDDSALTTAESSASLPPEPETGNIEYKLKLDDLSPSRFEELVTQMKWRLHEGQGRAEYVIGVNDDGVVVGLSRLVFDRSIRNLQKMASKLDAEVHVPEVMTTTETKLWAKVIVAAVIEASVVGLDDLRVAFVGAAGCGKSSLISVISRQRPDDGHGSARLHLFQHRHEISSGRTSSIITETVGWDKNDRLVRDPDLGRALRTLTMIDLAGHEKYIRTTLYGLTAHNPHLIVLVVNAASNARKFWLNARFLRCLGRPLVIVLNKIELSDQNRIEHLVKTISAESNVVLKMVANRQEAAQIAHQLNSSA